MSTDESQSETETTEVEAPEIPDRPSGVTNEQWSEFVTKFDAFAERVEKGLTAKRPAAPKAQQVTTPSRKPVEKTEEKTPEKTPEEKPKGRSKGYWG